MKVFTSTSFIGRWPVGSAAVIVANSEEEALSLLKDELTKRGLRQEVDSKVIDEELDIDTARAVILCDGEY